jgi:plastocyanin
MKLAFALTIAALVFARDASSETRAGNVTGHVLVFEDGKPAKRDEVWVYLEAVSPRRRSGSTTPPAREIRQVKERFVPHALVVPVGTTVAFPNWDHQEHNVFSPTDPPGQFDLGRYNEDHKGKAHTFEDPAEMQIYCDIHKNMSAFVKVVETDEHWIAKVGVDGNYAISDVPPGTYKVHVWTYASSEVIKSVAVASDQSVTAAEAHVTLGKIPSHLRKDGSQYTIYKP